MILNQQNDRNERRRRHKFRWTAISTTLFGQPFKAPAELKMHRILNDFRSLLLTSSHLEPSLNVQEAGTLPIFTRTSYTATPLDFSVHCNLTRKAFFSAHRLYGSYTTTSTILMTAGRSLVRGSFIYTVYINLKMMNRTNT
jgi:hypothetical protein